MSNVSELRRRVNDLSSRVGRINLESAEHLRSLERDTNAAVEGIRQEYDLILQQQRADQEAYVDKALSEINETLTQAMEVLSRVQNEYQKKQLSEAASRCAKAIEENKKRFEEYFESIKREKDQVKTHLKEKAKAQIEETKNILSKIEGNRLFAVFCRSDIVKIRSSLRSSEDEVNSGSYSAAVVISTNALSTAESLMEKCGQIKENHAQILDNVNQLADDVAEIVQRLKVYDPVLYASLVCDCDAEEYIKQISMPAMEMIMTFISDAKVTLGYSKMYRLNQTEAEILSKKAAALRNKIPALEDAIINITNTMLARFNGACDFINALENDGWYLIEEKDIDRKWYDGAYAVVKHDVFGTVRLWFYTYLSGASFGNRVEYGEMLTDIVDPGEILEGFNLYAEKAGLEFIPEQCRGVDDQLMYCRNRAEKIKRYFLNFAFVN